MCPTYAVTASEEAETIRTEKRTLETETNHKPKKAKRAPQAKQEPNEADLTPELKLTKPFLRKLAPKKQFEFQKDELEELLADVANPKLSPYVAEIIANNAKLLRPMYAEKIAQIDLATESARGVMPTIELEMKQFQ